MTGKEYNSQESGGLSEPTSLPSTPVSKTDIPNHNTVSDTNESSDLSQASPPPVSSSIETPDDTEVGINQKTHMNNMYDTENMNQIFSEEDQFYGIMTKYWKQRHAIFSKYDDGILLTKELWFSVTPEVVSEFTAKLINHCFKDKAGHIYVMDAFAGGGGNVNQFLEYADIVFAADINKVHLYCTKHNAQVYYTEEKIGNRLKLLPLNWIYAADDIDDDFVDETFENSNEMNDVVGRVYVNKEESLESLQILKNVKLDCIFGSPPWGGPEYIFEKYYNLDHLLPYPLQKLLPILLRYTDNVCLFLPKNTNLIQVQKITRHLFGSERYVRVLRTGINTRAKGLLICWGPAFVNMDLESIEM